MRAKRALRDSEGMALVLVLTVLALLTAVVVEFSYGVYINTSALYNWQTAQKLSLQARSAMRMASKIISENAGSYAYTRPDLLKDYGENVFSGEEGTALVRIGDEASRFNVNALVFPNGTLNEKAYQSFVRLLKALDLNPEIAQRVADWIDPDQEPRLGDSEKDAKNGYLDSVDELLLIHGIDAESYAGLLPYVTIYGDGRININSAGIPVLMSLSDSIDKEMAGRIVHYRENTPFEKAEDIMKVAGFETVGTSLMGSITVKGTLFHITSIAEGKGIKRVIESVVGISGGSAVVRYWKEI